MPTPKSKTDRMLADYWRHYVDSGRGGALFVARNLGYSLRALRGIQKLPRIFPPQPSDSPGGRAVERVITQKGPLGLPARWWGFVGLPVQAASLDRPEAKQLRYSLRQAEAAGITCRPVDAGERIRLVELARERERHHPDPTYRVDRPQTDDLLAYELWIVAEDEAGTPLVLAVAATDGEFAVLRYFRTLGSGENYSLSRYVAHQAIVEVLAAQGVRWLLDNTPPAAQTNGVRHFQRILGYRHLRIRRPVAE